LRHTSPNADIDQMTADITGSNTAGIDSGVANLRAGIKTGWVSANLWQTWLPALAKDKRYDDVMDLTMLGIENRPETAAIGPILEIRAQTLLVENKPDEALAAAKSYYNACAFRDTTKAVDLVAQCLAKARATDTEIGRKFRSEQLAASLPADADAPAGPDVAYGEPILKGVTIDASIWETAIQTWAAKTDRASDRGGYANLLLAADRGKEAEAVFREIYLSAASNEDYVIGAEGIARALRTEDGTIARSNAWLASIEPINKPAPAATPATPARPARPAGTGTTPRNAGGTGAAAAPGATARPPRPAGAAGAKAAAPAAAVNANQP
jgi:hypothetical protein